jgi:hypothetical protein
MPSLIQSYQDAERAVTLDEKNIKAYFLMGETLAEIAVHSKDRGKIEHAIEQLRKCMCGDRQRCDFVPARASSSSKNAS